jgi:hypothetical protein
MDYFFKAIYLNWHLVAQLPVDNDYDFGTNSQKKTNDLKIGLN